MKVGILGGGQLAQMLAQAGQKLGMQFAFLCPDEEACAAPYGQHIKAAYDDKTAQQALLDWSDVVTYEFENVPVSLVDFLEEHIPLHPSSTVLASSSDRFVEKSLFHTLGIKTADFVNVDSTEDLRQAVTTIGLPSILKTRREGYDGKGQVVLRQPSDVETAWERLGVPCILESMVPFQRELSIIAVRSSAGELAFYPLSENHHREGILRLSLSVEDAALQAKAQAMINRLLDHLNYVGVLALELFQVGDELFANEMAPRVHNSGHWTIEGARTSQFENHLRAVAGQPLGDTSLVAPTAMVNLIGEVPAAVAFQAIPDAIVHDYGKTPRAGRKVGHVTLTAEGTTLAEFKREVANTLALVKEDALVEYMKSV